MKVTFLEIAEIELDDAVEYYNIERSGLGNEFLHEVINTINRIVAYPDAAAPCSLTCRRGLVKRFPYGIIYITRENELLIVAVAHLHRKPEHWHDRI